MVMTSQWAPSTFHFIYIILLLFPFFLSQHDSYSLSLLIFVDNKNHNAKKVYLSAVFVFVTPPELMKPVMRKWNAARNG